MIIVANKVDELYDELVIEYRKMAAVLAQVSIEDVSVELDIVANIKVKLKPPAEFFNMRIASGPSIDIHPELTV